MTLTIYMKSGNKIKLPFVKLWAIKYSSDAVVSLSITRYKWAFWGTQLIMGSIALSQIEAITRG